MQLGRRKTWVVKRRVCDGQRALLDFPNEIIGLVLDHVAREGHYVSLCLGFAPASKRCHALVHEPGTERHRIGQGLREDLQRIEHDTSDWDMDYFSQLKVQSPDLCRLLLQRSPKNRVFWGYFDPRCSMDFGPRSEETYIAEILSRIRHQTPELCRLAVSREGTSIYCVREQTLDLCFLAVENDPRALEFIQSEFLIPKLCLMAVRKHARALRYLCPQPQNLCLEALRIDARAFKYINVQSEKLCIAAVKQNPNVLGVMPVSCRTYDVCLEAVCRNGKLLKYVPRKRQSYEIQVTAVWNDGDALKYVLAAPGQSQLGVQAKIIAAMKRQGHKDLVGIDL